jgi:hypothetical protein
MNEFETFWASYWKQNTMPGVMNEAFKEIAKAAWDAAINTAIVSVIKVHDDILQEKIKAYNFSLDQKINSNFKKEEPESFNIVDLRNRLKNIIINR